MPKQLFVDFKAVKAAVTMEQVLEHYSLLDRFKRSGDSLSGPCPIHKGDNPTQFRVSISKNVWHCFSECKHGGNVLDFIAKMEGVSIHAAALRAIEWFSLDPESMSGSSDEQTGENDDNGRAPQAIAKKPIETPENVTPNKPLKFRLEKLERQHPYLIERGLSLETVIDFGVGFCSKGMMAGRIAIPIHTLESEVVAYVGRFPGEPPAGTPKYKLPQGFRKSLELFNIDRASKEGPEKPLIIVEGFVRDELKAFFGTPEKIAAHLSDAKRNLSEKETALAAHEREINKVREEMTRTHKLYVEGQVTAQGFGNFYRPAEERLNQLLAELSKLQSAVDVLKINDLDGEAVLAEARTLYDAWPAMTQDEKRKIAESLIEKIVIGEGEIDITFSYLPTAEELCKSQQQLRGQG